MCQSIAGLEVFSFGKRYVKQRSARFFHYIRISETGGFCSFLTAFLESYFASTTEILISFSVLLRSNAPPSATLTRSSYSVPSESVSTALPASSVIDHRQHSVRTVGIELQSSGIPGKIVHPERDRRVVVDVFDCHGVEPACSEISVPIIILYT